ncbi:hypothetical protein L3Q82_001964 [Scortum barcoo]|uniref:Uncharacterized protein n=1 Tax=Scortum barcoo TaxID=214431 RepID=A0ACB8W1B2_9TELE|nr:hypothetical protein L3Q82_001964 [Scortum barcoo]
MTVWPAHSTNTITKFADNTAIIGLLTGDDETAYREEVRGQSPDILVPGQQPPSQHQQNKTKDKGADRGLQEEAERRDYCGESQQLQAAEAQHGLKDPLQLLQLTHREDPDWLHHRLVWQLHRPQPCKALQRVVKAAQHIVRTELPSMEDLYTQRCRRRATMIIMDPSHPATDCSVSAAAVWPTVPQQAFEPEPPGSGKLHPAGHKTLDLASRRQHTVLTRCTSVRALGADASERSCAGLAGCRS